MPNPSQAAAAGARREALLVALLAGELRRSEESCARCVELRLGLGVTT